MHPFIDAALTGKRIGPVETGTPLDDLLVTLSSDIPEYTFLLQVGTFATYCTAGHKGLDLSIIIAPQAPLERLPACPREMAGRVGELLRGSVGTEPELLELLELGRETKWRLPHSLLSSALALASKAPALRGPVVRVLGERGLVVEPTQSRLVLGARPSSHGRVILPCPSGSDVLNLEECSPQRHQFAKCRDVPRQSEAGKASVHLRPPAFSPDRKPCHFISNEEFYRL